LLEKNKRLKIKEQKSRGLLRKLREKGKDWRKKEEEWKK